MLLYRSDQNLFALSFYYAGNFIEQFNHRLPLRRKTKATTALNLPSFQKSPHQILSEKHNLLTPHRPSLYLSITLLVFLMSFSYLTDQLLLHIFQFLEWQDYSNLPLTCKRFSTVMANHEKYWARECLRTYLPMDLDYCRYVFQQQSSLAFHPPSSLPLTLTTCSTFVSFSEFYESQEYCKDLKSQIEKIQGKNWKSQFQRMNEVRTQLRNMIKGFVSGPEASIFVNDFYDQFRSKELSVYGMSN